MRLTLFFLIISINFLFSQKDSSRIECKYLTSFLIDTTDSYTRKQEITSLLIGDHVSLFRSDAKARYDSLTNANVSMAVPKNGTYTIDFSNIPKAYFIQEIYYKNHNPIVYDKILNIVFAFEPENKIEWKLVNDTKTISTFTCKKAVGKYGKKQITAWYTDEIPFQEGPYNFKGLPGLIVEAYDENDFFHFTLKSLKNIKKPIEPITFSMKTDYPKFVKKRLDFQKDPIGAFFASTGRTVSKEQQERIIKMHRSKNNHLD
ncbi:hypothetical protein IW15_13355 [Chryseobacterium soli]|uniref:GLPGLI family protein n=1 Tax=Chryseobacterium soli TaxID=445961 RepID=A0A086A751_9FLAO|nr:GLPGLI family protein [Chryseobacterium soli]KFF12515.1 hypothetical protein IW15_13355 [Chryseobacterium soli]